MRSVFWGLLLLIILPCYLFAQSANPSASLGGVISDAAGAVIPGATVTVRNADTGIARSAVTDAAGAFRLLSLSPGEYEIKVEAAGFGTLTRNEVTLLVGQNAALNLSLSPVGASTEVNITDEAPAVDIAAVSASVSVDQERIEELPVQQRRFLNFVLTAPGVIATGQQLRGGGARLGAAGARNLPDSGFSFGGLRPRSNNIAIDGVDNNDETTGASRAELSIEAIREFQVVNNGVSAEYGGSAGGSVNAVTRSGSNEFHGGVFLYAGRDVLNARQPVFAADDVASKRTKLHRWQPGFDVGGPIRENQSFFHATMEQEHESTEDASDIDPLIAARLNAALGAGVLPRLGLWRHGLGRLTSDLFPSAGDDTEGAFKLNQQIGESRSLMLRYAFTNDRRWRDALGAGGLSDVSARGDSFTRDHALVGQYLHVITPHAVNEIRFQLAQRRVLFRPNEQSGPQLLIPGVLTFGRLADAPSDREESHYQWLDTLTLSRGHHQFRFGGGINHVRLDAGLQDRQAGFAVFDSVDDLLAGRAELFAQFFGDPRTRYSITSMGIFMQDHWQARPRLTLDLGLRYDYEALPAGLARDPKNLSPRIGFAWGPDEAHQWVVRGAYGIYFDRYLLAFLNPAIQKDGVRGFDQFLTGPAAAEAFRQSQGGPLAAPLGTVKPSIYRADPRMQTPYSQQATIGIERKLFGDVTLSLNYLFVKGTHLPRTRNINLPPPAQPLGRPVFGPGRLDSRYDAIYQLEDSSASNYHGLTASLGRRLTKSFGLQVSYTFSKAIDDASDFDEQPQNPYDLRAERALSRQDQRHRFVFSGMFTPFGNPEAAGPKNENFPRKFLRDLELAPLVTLGSGRVFNPLTGGDDLRTLALPLSARPAGLVRNGLRGGSQKNIDLRVLERFWLNDRKQLLDFAVDFLNLTNTTNPRELNPFYGRGTLPQSGYGRIIDSAGPRRIQLSVEFEF